MSPRRVFIAGCQRSGTTLVRLILEAHPEVACLDERDAYRVLLPPRSPNPRPSPESPPAELLVLKIPRFCEQLLRREMADPEYGTFPSFYAGEPVLFLLRDPRDVVSSMRSLPTGDGGMTWLDRYGPEMLRFHLQRRGEEVSGSLRETLDRSGWAPHVVGAVYWVLKNAPASEYVAAGLPVRLVIYEDLVADPEPLLRRAAGFLGIRWDDALLAHHAAEHDQLRPDGRTIGLSDPRAPIHQRSVGRYRDDLTDAEAGEVMEVAGRLWEDLTRLGRARATGAPTEGRPAKQKKEPRP